MSNKAASRRYPAGAEPDRLLRSRWAVGALLVILSGALALTAPQAPSGPADLILYNGRVVSVDARFSVVASRELADTPAGCTMDVRCRACGKEWTMT